MAQLTNDCFAFGGELMRLEEAVRLMAGRVGAVTGTELVPLEEADGRVLAEDVTATVDLPPFDNSAVDGYAVRHGDLSAEGDSRLPIAGRVAAGAAPEGLATAGQAVRIFTGAPLPAGADTVFMQEDVRVEDGLASLPQGLARGANRRLAGEDLPKGENAMPAGRRLTAREVGLLAALGLPTVRVRQRLRVALFSTGNEVVAPGQPLAPARLYDANRFMLGVLLRRAGCIVTDLGILPDTRQAVGHALAGAAGAHDLLLTSGGVSAGDEDHVKAAVEQDGALAFWRVGIKPGRPVAMGVVRGTPFIGLPGNPVAAFVTFSFLARPLIARLGGESHQPPLPVPVTCGFSHRKKAGRREFVRVRLAQQDGAVLALKHPQDGAGVITSLTATDGLVVLPEEVTSAAPGDRVGFLPYGVLS
ncbi:molybdopterin molybdotransferase MoeA [Geminicoccus flavidas]|uniref:molybdopterin molybdotransferase MoeA n=1 Tax=Geminicoccus flavidas TaxID=2506407 RepID=UPI00135B29E4|nr:gephyrin-like molybdotransferase Glp [Geminicoccus flavidas]